MLRISFYKVDYYRLPIASLKEEFLDSILLRFYLEGWYINLRRLELNTSISNYRLLLKLIGFSLIDNKSLSSSYAVT